MLAIATFAAITWPPVTWLLSRPFEARYPIRPFNTGSDYGAIIVLSSAISPPQYERPYYLPDEDSFHRCTFASWLYCRKPVPLMVCGGRGERNEQPYSVSMQNFLVRLGVPTGMIWTEEQSSSTYENALYGAQKLKQHGIRRVALVIDATSMPRAQACFLKQGIEVVPAPSDYYEPRQMMLPTWKSLRQDELMLHEALGLCWYRLTGRI